MVGLQLGREDYNFIEKVGGIYVSYFIDYVH